MYLGITNTGYSTSYFIPTILNELGWTSVHAQVMSIPIYVAAFVVILITAVCTDLLRHRYAFIMAGISIATIGYVMLLAQKGVPVIGRYFAIYLITVGCYIAQPIILVWLNNSMGGHYKKSTCAAMQIGFGSCAGLVASNIYITEEAPVYPVGYGVSLALMWLSGFACTVFFVGLWLENRKRDRGGRDYRFNLPREELENMGDDHPGFRFGY